MNGSNPVFSFPKTRLPSITNEVLADMALQGASQMQMLQNQMHDQVKQKAHPAELRTFLVLDWMIGCQCLSVWHYSSHLHQHHLFPQLAFPIQWRFVELICRVIASGNFTCEGVSLLTFNPAFIFTLSKISPPSPSHGYVFKEPYSTKSFWTLL